MIFLDYSWMKSGVLIKYDINSSRSLIMYSVFSRNAIAGYFSFLRSISPSAVCSLLKALLFAAFSAL